MKYTILILTLLSSAHTYTANAGQTDNAPFDLDTTLAPYEANEQTSALATHFQSVTHDATAQYDTSSCEAEMIAHAAIIALKRRGYPMLPNTDNREIVSELFPEFRMRSQRFVANSLNVICTNLNPHETRQSFSSHDAFIAPNDLKAAYTVAILDATHLHADQGAAALTACIEKYLRELPLQANADG